MLLGRCSREIALAFYYVPSPVFQLHSLRWWNDRQSHVVIVLWTKMNVVHPAEPLIGAAIESWSAQRLVWATPLLDLSTYRSGVSCPKSPLP